jgi:hypothetical protein
VEEVKETPPPTPLVVGEPVFEPDDEHFKKKPVKAPDKELVPV